MITIKDIARETGFSFKTVSRVINGETGVAESTSEKIQEAIGRLGYVANPMAGSLKSGKTGLVGILTGKLGLSIKSSKLYATQKYLEKAGRQSILSCNEFNISDLDSILNPLFPITDGLIVLHPPNNSELLIRLEHYGKPVLLVDGFSHNLTSITIDRERGILEAFSKFQSEYDDFIYLNSMKDSFNDGRYRGFINSANHLPPGKSSQIIDLEKEGFEGGYSFGLNIKNIIKRNRRSLFFCTNDQIAFGFMKGLYERKIAVPEMAGVVGFDGDNYGPYGYKSLATIKQPVDELGELTVETMEILLKKGQPRKNLYVQTHFIPGDSA